MFIAIPQLYPTVPRFSGEFSQAPFNNGSVIPALDSDIYQTARRLVQQQRKPSISERGKRHRWTRKAAPKKKVALQKNLDGSVPPPAKKAKKTAKPKTEIPNLRKAHSKLPVNKPIEVDAETQQRLADNTMAVEQFKNRLLNGELPEFKERCAALFNNYQRRIEAAGGSHSDRNKSETLEGFIEEKARELAEEKADKMFPVDPDNKLFPNWDYQDPQKVLNPTAPLHNAPLFSMPSNSTWVQPFYGIPGINHHPNPFTQTYSGLGVKRKPTQ
jgi:hypothetical protein